ncbi:hypothetical protein NPIL_676971 [Nephila pilipes]|uniref:Uncharacterized protein n=1 Tax=Nephila pilipes TaxID=299642 RepID=A0A8X6PFB7_NEPPI|nr:hypothetical protein NPIL_676971 [Nephila pilipes]
MGEYHFYHTSHSGNLKASDDKGQGHHFAESTIAVKWKVDRSLSIAVTLAIMKEPRPEKLLEDPPTCQEQKCIPSDPGPNSFLYDAWGVKDIHPDSYLPSFLNRISGTPCFNLRKKYLVSDTVLALFCPSRSVENDVERLEALERNNKKQ